jgi:hypothetical protein
VSQNWYSTEHQVLSDTTLGEAAELKRQLRAVEGLKVVDKGDGKLWLLIGEPTSLQDAPPGSHEYARGFLLFSTMLAARHALGNKDVWWDECEVVSTDGPRLRPTGHQVKVTYSGHQVGRVETA